MTLDELQGSDAHPWADHYEEPHHGLLYRRDDRGHWYDVAGHRLYRPVFLKGDVLVSLTAKRSRRSLSFRDATLRSSPGGRLIQVGRLVLDASLEPLRYFGDRVAGLGPASVSLGGERYQEVLIGLTERRFVGEHSLQPLLADGKEVTTYTGPLHYAMTRLESFLAKDGGQYAFGTSANDLLTIDERPVTVEPDTLARVGDRFVLRVRRGDRSFFIDLNRREALEFTDFPGQPVLELSPIDRMGSGPATFFNARTARQSFVYNAATDDPLALDGGSVYPTGVARVPGFERYLFYAEVDGKFLLCSHQNRSILRFGPEERTVAQLEAASPTAPLLNATDSLGEPLVLDARRGLNDLRLAVCGERPIVRVRERAFRLGVHHLQHADLRGLGGELPRVLYLDEPELRPFTLDPDLKAYSDQSLPSAFAGLPLLHIDPQREREIGAFTFREATFVSWEDSTHTAWLNVADGRPLHLDGAGHRNELVTAFVDSTLNARHHLGDHRMIGALTLTEEHRRGELLFSATTLASWLPFQDGFLPILRRAVHPEQTEEGWDYTLFELREADTVSGQEFLAAERRSPYRLLAEKRGGRLVPKVVGERTKALADPEAARGWQRVFVAGAVLARV